MKKRFQNIETLADAMRRAGFHRLDKREIELKLNRPLSAFENRAHIIAQDSRSSQNGVKRQHANRQESIRMNGQQRFKRLRDGTIRDRGPIDRSVDFITDQRPTDRLPELKPGRGRVRWSDEFPAFLRKGKDDTERSATPAVPSDRMLYIGYGKEIRRSENIANRKARGDD